METRNSHTIDQNQFIAAIINGEGPEDRRILASSDNVSKLTIELLTMLDLACDGTQGYIAEKTTGTIISKHRKQALV